MRVASRTSAVTRPAVHLPAPFVGLLALGLFLPVPAAAQTTDYLRRELAGVGVDEKLGAQVPLDVEFLDETGRTVSLRKWSGRPILLSLNYTTCPMLCSLQLAGIAKGLKDLGDDGPERFEVVTLSIDPSERHNQLVRFKRLYVGQAGGSSVLAQRWHFLSGADDRIHRIADAIGFRYRFDAENRQFRHKATLVVLGPDGRISSYLHGITAPAPRLREALERAARGDVIDPDEQAGIGGFLLNCFAFDPKDHKPLALQVMRSGGIVAMLFLFGFLGRLVVRERRARKP